MNYRAVARSKESAASKTASIRRLILRLVIPITIVSFAVFTKWWYALPVDAPDTMYSGFPFPYMGEGWASSMSVQYFAIEFVADLLFYFLFWFVVIIGINYFLIKIRLYKLITIVLWALSGLVIVVATLVYTTLEHTVFVKRDYKMEMMTEGYKFIWQNVQRPDFNKYHAQKK